MIQKIKSFLFENKSDAQTIAKNTFWLTFGTIASRSIRAIMIMYAARILGTEGYGIFSYALSFASLFSVFSDFGLSGTLTRQAVQQPEKIKTYLSTTFLIKTGALFITILITIIIGPLITNVSGIKELLPIVAILLAFDSLRGFAISLARARNKMEIESGVNLITDGFISGLGIIALILLPTAKFLAYGYTAGVAIGTIITFFILRKDMRGILNHFDKETAKKVFSSSWPFALMGLFGSLMINIDTLIIGWFRTAHDLGLYGAAQRPVLFLYLLPALFAASLFPIISRYFSEERMEKIGTVMEKSISISMFFGFPILVGGVVVGIPLTVFIFGGSFINASLPFQILLFTVPLVFAGTIMGNALFACHKQKVFITAYGLGALANVILDLLLIPKYGVSGSAVATLVSQLFSNGWLWINMQKTIPFSLFRPIRKILASSIVMGVFCVLISPYSPHVLFTIALGSVVYILSLLILKEGLILSFKEKLRTF